MLPWNVIKQYSIFLNNEANDYDCVLLNSNASISHFINQKIHTGYLLIHKDNSMDLVIGAFEAPFIMLKGKNKIHVAKKGWREMIEIIKDILNKRSYQKLAVESQIVTYSFWKKVLKTFPQKLIWIDTEQIRRIKTKYQIDLLKKAAAAVDKVFQNTSLYIKKERTNLSEHDIAKFIRHEAIKLNGEVSFDVIVASGINGKYPHAVPTTKKIQNNELITIDCGVKLNNYCSDMTRMLSLGKVRDKDQEIYDYIIEAQKAAISKLKSGVDFFKLHEESVNIFKKYNVEMYYTHGIGHGIGQMVHECPYPSSSKNGNSILMENDIITIEPGLYDLHSTGGRIEDMFIVKKGGYVQMTHSSKDLVI